MAGSLAEAQRIHGLLYHSPTKKKYEAPSEEEDLKNHKHTHRVRERESVRETGLYYVHMQLERTGFAWRDRNGGEAKK